MIPPKHMTNNDQDFEQCMSGEPHHITVKNKMTRSGTWVCQNLKQCYLVQDCKDGVCHHQIQKYVFRAANLVFCTNTDGLLCFGLWPLAIRKGVSDDSVLILKAVLLHNCNVHPSISDGCAAHSNNQKVELLKHIQYKNYNWNICGELKSSGSDAVCFQE